MRHEMLTQHAPFCIGARDGKKGTLSQHFVMHVVPPLVGRSLQSFDHTLLL